MEKNQAPKNKEEEEGALLHIQKDKKNMACISKLCWIIQIVLWMGGFTFLIIDIRKKGDNTGSYEPTIEFILVLIFVIIIYVIYIILQFCSPTFYYLRHKRPDILIYDKIKKLFYYPPRIQFVCECYHYEIKGSSTKNAQAKKVITKVATKYFNYYSSRDVSGLFKLNNDKSSIADKYYVKLELLTDFSFADSVSYNDYLKEKDEFCNTYKNFDIHMDFSQINDINGLNKYNLINITESNPCGMSCFWFIVFTFLGIVQLYKAYINSKCINIKFTIRKIISTRYSLTTEECNIKYKKFDPVFSSEKEKINFPSSEIGYVSFDFRQQIPSQEEIRSAEKYRDKVFRTDENKNENLNVEFKNIKNKYNDNDDLIRVTSLGDELLPDQFIIN